MEQIKLIRIKKAGRNISTIGYLILFSTLIAVIGIVHLSSTHIDPNQIRHYYLGYGTAYALIHILIIINVITAGDNLKMCDVEPFANTDVTEKQVVYRETTENQILKIISTDYKTIGAEVYINEHPAPDGEYLYKNDNRKLYVKAGKIEKMITI